MRLVQHSNRALKTVKVDTIFLQKTTFNDRLVWLPAIMVLKDRFERLTSHSTGFGGGH
jgi:hypothetical protein